MKSFLQAWFALTATEHKALVLVAALLLLGLAARYLILEHPDKSPSPKRGNREQPAPARP